MATAATSSSRTMQLSATRYVKIEGTNVSAAVNSAAEAKHAIKEVRQKKRELAHIKRGLLRDKRVAEQQVSQGKPKRGVKQGFFSKVRSAFTTLAGMTGVYGKAGAMLDLPRIERECTDAEEILHNLDAVLIQLQGKLLHLS
ncbi:MAG: hypothetical protein ABL874_12245 [Sphingopyxis sp.]